LEKCFWKKIPLQIWVNEQEVTIIDTHITQGAITQAPYGFWRNDTAVFLNTADNNFLEGTNFNYSCRPTSARPPCYDKYQMPKSKTLNPLPELISCSTLIQIPFVISDGGLSYCQSISITNNTVTGGIGFSIASSEVDCVVKVMDSSEIIFYITLHTGSYGFFREAIYINCKEAAIGIYTNCGLENFSVIHPINMSYNWGAEIEVVSDNVIGGDSGFDWPNPFSSLLGNTLSTAISYIIMAAIVLTGIVIGIIILRCLISHCQARGKGGGN
jgi:hypothetical protein